MCTDLTTDFTTPGITQTREFTSSDGVGMITCISVTIIDDEVADPDEMFKVLVSSQTTRLTVQGGSTATITIINNDGQCLYVNASLVLLCSTSSIITSKKPHG